MAAADHDSVLEGRGYVPNYTVRYRGSQRAEHRFGPGRRADIQEMLHLQDEGQDPSDFAGQWDDFPRVARARMNLTALAQHYDLYFVAYRGYIYVYRPNRGVKVALEEPEVILDPKYHETPMSKHVDGYINPTCPHEINHMVVGELGDEEILLVGKDNGDVIAWYTQSIAHYIETSVPESKKRSQRNNERSGYVSRRPNPNHFFADNVGISAWGLAIHKASRLIAVSSNAHEITVFAFAMNRKGDAAVSPPAGSDENDIPEATPTGGQEAVDTSSSSDHMEAIGILKGDKAMGDGCYQLPLFCSNWVASIPELERQGLSILRKALVTEKEAQNQVAKLQRRFQTRQRSWRIVLSLGMGAANIPSIAFCEDAEGNANRVAAIDINGYLYIVDIWHIGRRPVRIPPHNVQTPVGRRHTPVRGWNVLPIMDAQLLPTDTVHAAIGLHLNKAIHRAKTSRGTWLDISKCMPEIPHDAASKLHQRRIANFRPSDVSGERDGLTLGGLPSEVDALATPILSSQVFDPVLDPNDGIDFGAGPVRLAMTIVPYSGAHFAAFPTPEALVEFSGPRAASNRAQSVRAALTHAQFRQQARLWDAEDLLRDVSFLRFNEHDVEMLALNEPGCGTVCHQIPELNLVIMGSMCGRVALLTLTKPPQPEVALAAQRSKVPQRAFRVDAVLPFEAEERSKERPYVCLLGIAVSPVPEARTHGLELRRRVDGRAMEQEPPRRWRLILNYQDHTVLQYEIVRREEGEKGSWKDFTGPTTHAGGKFRAMGSDEEDDGTKDAHSESDDGSDVDDSDLGTDLTEADHPGGQDLMMVALDEEHWVETDSDDDDFPDMQTG
ncbi:hypothetical protein VP1G_03880 [Cytospora mali]|uniref:Uncharacterized protein n=1 Tax=Cytospora mali TaxID=578113 RepID=A0A194UY15_CYTMA|nr:hypothetical protein VP1G_03880 [Valsa mali var. pyri (nom. inval.)]